MKAVGTALKAHLAQTVTTLATCWQMIRLDGMMFAFTSFDQDLVISGVTYKSTVGFSRSAIQTGSTGQVDNVDVLGYFSEDGIIEEDLKNGIFDYATVYLFTVNWANLAQGICRLRRGWLGQCIRTPIGIFEAELRGLTQALVQEFGNVYQPICRADLGDTKCKIPIRPADWLPGHVYQLGDYVQAATKTTDALSVAVFQAQNAGNTGSEPVWNTAIGAVTIDTNGVNPVHWLSVPYWRGIGTVVTPIDTHRFVSSSLSVPALGTINPVSAIIGIRANVSRGTVVTITDGVVSMAWNAYFDLRAADALEYLYEAIRSSALNMTVSKGSYLTINLTNNSGQPGDVEKLGDQLGAIVIQNFASTALDAGTLTWISGQNIGRSMEMKTFDPGSNTVTMWLGMYYPILAGDRFFYYPGCDKRRDTCQKKFNNILNNRSEPDMPGMDALLSYPDA